MGKWAEVDTTDAATAVAELAEEAARAELAAGEDGWVFGEPSKEGQEERPLTMFRGCLFVGGAATASASECPPPP